MKRPLFCSVILLICSGIAWAQSNPQDSACAEEKARADRMEQRLRDWPNLQRYREANSKVTAPAKDEKRVVFMGDSITDGWKLADYFSNKPYINRGIGGQTTPQMLLRF